MTLADLIAEVARHREALDRNTEANRELAEAIASRRRRRAPEPALPHGHTYAGAPLTDRSLHDVERVREALLYGWGEPKHDPPRPLPPGHEEPLPRLQFWRSIHELVGGGMTADELLDAVDEVADLVEAGQIPATSWTNTYVFSGHLAGLRIKHREWRRDQAAAERNRRAIQAAMGVEVAQSDAPLSAEVAESGLRRLIESTKERNATQRDQT